MADQLVPMLTGAYGHPVVQTPNLSRLVRDGVRFDAAYSPSPLCAPARACLMTGTHTSTNRVYDNAALLASDIPTFAHYLTNAGYDCVLSGKMHFVGPDQLHGFRARFTPDIAHEELVTYSGRPPWSFSRDPASFRVEDGRARAGRARAGRAYVGSEIHVGRWHFHLAYDDEVQFRAVEYLRARGATSTQGAPAAAGSDQPFCLVTSYHHPHDPFWPPQDVWDLYDGAEIDLPELPANLDETYSVMDRWLNANHGTHALPELRDPATLRRLRRAYYALVTYVDRKVGELIQTLENHGLWDDTVVVFRPLIDGSDTSARTVFSEEHVEEVATTCFMVRRGPWKYVHIHGLEAQLFNLEADPGEWHNLAGDPAHATVEAELRAALLERFDPDAIERDVRRSLAARRVIRDAMTRTGTLWGYRSDFDPNRDALRQYLPRSLPPSA